MNSINYAMAESVRTDSIVNLDVPADAPYLTAWITQLEDACEGTVDAGTENGVRVKEFYGPDWRVHLHIRQQ